MEHLGPKLKNDLAKPSGSKTQVTQISLEAGRHFSQNVPLGFWLMEGLGPKLKNALLKASG